MRRRLVGLCPVLSRSLLVTALVASCGGDDSSEVPDAGAGAAADASVSLAVEVGSVDVVVAAGEALPLYVAVVRGDWAGDVVVTASGLPAGATAESVTLTGEESETYLRLEVDEGSMPGGPHPIEVTAVGGGLTASELVQLEIRRRGGRLDGAFSGDGVFYDPFVGGSDRARGLEVLRSGQVLVGLDRLVSTFRLAIARLTPEGAVDVSFGDEGIAGVDAVSFDSWTWTVQPDAERILVMRLGDFAEPGFVSLEVSAFTPEGQPDDAFGVQTSLLDDPEGTAFAICCAVALPDGGAYMAATYGFSVAGNMLLRIGEDGRVDRAFGADGVVRWSTPDAARGLAVQPDGHVLVAGGRTITRFTPRGDLDERFGERVIPGAEIADVVWTSRGIVLTGRFGESFIRRLTDTGEIDPSFARERPFQQLDGHGRRVRQDAEGSLLVAGAGSTDGGSTGFVARFLADGTPDPFFGAEGFVTAPLDAEGRAVVRELTEMTIGPAGRILAGGTRPGKSARDRAVVVAYTP